jgi:hypothetical protein
LTTEAKAEVVTSFAVPAAAKLPHVSTRSAHL